MATIRERSGIYQPKQPDLETVIAKEISKTGREQIRKRRKAGLSVFYLKNGTIVELKPDQTEVKGRSISTRWVSVEKSKRKLILK